MNYLWKCDGNVPLGKDHACFIVCLEVWYAAYEMDDLPLSVEYWLSRDYYQLVEQRGIDPGQEVLQIPAVLKNSQLGESGKDGLRRAWWALAFSTSGGFKVNLETFKPGQHGEARGHLLG
jgi:hypothetical protein